MVKAMKKLGFGTMRLPVINGNTAKVDLEKFSQMVDHYPRDKFTITTKLPVFLLQSNGMVYYSAYPVGTGKASACTVCGKCEAVCPKKLPIQDLPKKVAAAFETTAL